MLASLLVLCIAIISVILVDLLQPTSQGSPSAVSSGQPNDAIPGCTPACSSPDFLLTQIRNGTVGSLPASPQLLSAITLAQTIDSQAQEILFYVTPLETAVAGGGGWLLHPATVSDVQRRLQFEQEVNDLVERLQPNQLGLSSTPPPTCLSQIYRDWLNGRLGLFFDVDRETVELDYGVQRSFQSIKQLEDLANGVETALEAVRVSDCMASPAGLGGVSASTVANTPPPAVAAFMAHSSATSVSVPPFHATSLLASITQKPLAIIRSIDQEITRRFEPPLDSSISGDLSYPADSGYANQVIHGMRVCAINQASGLEYCTTDRVGEHGYRIAVPAGRYTVYATPSVGDMQGYKAFYTDSVQCGLRAGCGSGKPVIIDASPGVPRSGIDPMDWYSH